MRKLLIKFGHGGGDRNRPQAGLLKWYVSAFLFFYFSQNLSEWNEVSAEIPYVPPDNATPAESNNSPILRSFLEPCDIQTLETQCTEEEYENNEDCLPQKTDNCDHSKELFCLSGVCLPNCHPHKENYDHIEGKCFRKVGSDCKSSINVTTTPTSMPGEQSLSSPVSNQEGPFFTVIVPPCERNAVCERGLCRCAKDYSYDHYFNKCIMYAPYNSYCNDTVNCDRKSDIECRENKCQCRSPDMQYFHLKRKRCYILIGQVCSSGLQFCPDNSNCVRTKDEENDEDIKENAKSLENVNTIYSVDKRLHQLHQELIFGGGGEGNEEEHFIGILGDEEDKEFVCKCDKGYGSTRDKRHCLGLHGARCNTLHRCNAERGLVCHNGTCICDREIGNEQVYSKQFQTCITLVGAPCLANGKGEREEDICPIGASCMEGKCVCDNGLMPSSASMEQTTTSVPFSCMKSHGMACRHENNSFDIFEPPCNHERGLECDLRERRCLCKDSNQFYDVLDGRCKDFQKTNAKIPVIHFAPVDDREYSFRSISSRSHVDETFITTLFVAVLFLLIYVFLL